MKGLFKLHIYFGRQGDLDGIFIADIDKMRALVKSEQNVYFGEVLGKHSDIYCPITEKDYTFITSDDKVIEIVEKYELENGFNPFDYIEDEDDNE